MAAHYKILSLALLATLARCEPPVSGYNYRRPSYQPGFNFPTNNYLPPSTGYTPPSNSYQAPTAFDANSANSGFGHSGADNSSPGHSGLGQDSYDSGHGHGHGHGHDNEVPKSYEFGYSVKDAQSGNDYNRRESSDGNVVRGEYRVQLPDGRTQIVTYHADWQTGFHADVRYEGEARYPEPQRNNQGYNYNTPADFSGSLTGFNGNSNYKPSTAYGPPSYH